MSRTSAPTVAAIAAFIGFGTVLAQQVPVPQTPIEEIPTTPSSVSKLGPGLFRIGEIKVDTTKREASVPGRVNAVQTLEFVANTRGGMKSYESALSIDTNAVTFNAAMLMIGLDKEHAKVPTRHFDPVPPEGDRVALWIDWTRGGAPVRTPVEQLLYDNESHQPVPASDWVYTGSVFLPQEPTITSTRYLADIDGVLIGFVHSPAPIIENVTGAGVRRYGMIVMNPNLGLEPDTPVVLTVKALGSTSKPH
jgi:hypothetical protein